MRTYIKVNSDDIDTFISFMANQSKFHFIGDSDILKSERHATVVTDPNKECWIILYNDPILIYSIYQGDVYNTDFNKARTGHYANTYDSLKEFISNFDKFTPDVVCTN